MLKEYRHEEAYPGPAGCRVHHARGLRAFPVGNRESDEDTISSTNSAIAGLLGNGVRIEIKDVRKLGSPKSSAASYKCDVEWTATLPVLGDSKKLGTLTFMKASDGWAVSE